MKVILFDFDGTIADTVIPAAKILQRIAGEFGLKGLTDEAMQNWRNFSIPEILKQLHFPLWKLPFVAKRTKEEMNKQIEQIHPIANIVDVIKKIKKTHTIGIVTSNNKDNVEAFLKKNHMDFFDFIFTGTSIFGKARQIKNALEKNHITPQDVMYIGDEIRDIQACKKLSIPIVAVTWGFNTKQALQQYYPDYLISKPKKLLQIL